MHLKSLFSTLMWRACVVGMLGLSAIGSAAAADSPDVDLDAIRAQQTELRAEVVAGADIYGEMSKTKREQLVARQDDLLQLLEGKASFDELDKRQQYEAFNTLEWIKAAVNDAEDQRMICTRETKTGSHRKTKVCKTVAQRREDREEAKRKLNEQFQGGFCPPGGSCRGSGG